MQREGNEGMEVNAESSRCEYINRKGLKKGQVCGDYAKQKLKPDGYEKDIYICSSHRINCLKTKKSKNESNVKLALPDASMQPVVELPEPDASQGSPETLEANNDTFEVPDIELTDDTMNNDVLTEMEPITIDKPVEAKPMQLKRMQRERSEVNEDMQRFKPKNNKRYNPLLGFY